MRDMFVIESSVNEDKSITGPESFELLFLPLCLEFVFFFSIATNWRQGFV